MERWRAIDAASADQARARLRVCCGAPRWIERMIARRPFGSLEAARSAGRAEWFALSHAEWRDAFRHHPRIGDLESLRQKFASTAGVSAQEQSGVTGASADVLAALLQGNRDYEARFGYIFIVCATGKSAAEMLALLTARLTNAPEVEILIAAEEHATICDLRLAADDQPL